MVVWFWGVSNKKGVGSLEVFFPIYFYYLEANYFTTSFVLFGPNITDSKGQTQKRVTYINNYGRYKILIKFFSYGRHKYAKDSEILRLMSNMLINIQ